MTNSNETTDQEPSIEVAGRLDPVVMPGSGKHAGCIRGFYQLSKSWYDPANLTDPDILDRVSIGFFDPEGGTTGEFVVVWEKLAQKWVPRLKAFDGGWSALFNFGDLLESMANIDGEDIGPDEFVKLLEALDIKNLTPVTKA